MKHSIIASVTLAVLLPGSVLAQVTVSDDFTQASDGSDWATFDGACLTAGDNTGKIPKCVGLPYYQGQTLVGGQSGTLPDSPGFGALRFTNGFTKGGSGFSSGFNQAGGIISNFTFDAGSGISILFKTVTYRGNSGGNGGGTGVDAQDGADGMSFFLIDASYQPYDTGAFGGSLGYSCSNANDDKTLRADGTKRQYDGLMGAYLGLGIDEFGNFLNPSDNTHSGPGLQANRIGLRGAGSISWKSLNTAYTALYPSSWSQSDQDTAVQKTCKSGYLRDRYGNYYTSKTDPTQTSGSNDNGIPVADYAMITDAKGNPALKVLSGVNIANESALTRDQTQPDATRAIPIAYNLKITQDGLLSFSYSYNNGAFLPVITGQSIVASNGALPKSLRFGFAGSTGGSTNIHEILCFQATPSNQASTSIGVNQPGATKINIGITQAYLASYFQSDWTGRLTANPLYYDPALGIYAGATANWDASCNLTGVAKCTTTGAANVPAQDPSKRNILTWSDQGKVGIPFQFTSLTNTEQNALDAGDTTANDNRLKYLRGDRTNEINSQAVGLFRKRDNVLADIVDSSPVWVGYPVNPYPLTWKDSAHTSKAAPENGTGANSYPSFVTANQTRPNVVYSGANDGLLHGFRSGSFDASGKFTTATTPNDGAEVLAYMPGAVLNTIHNGTDPTLDYSNSQYGHNFFVDATPRADDLFYNNSWHTWLVGGLGAGGSAIYALDVTDPTKFSENNAASLVIGEWATTTNTTTTNGTTTTTVSSTFTCTNVTNCGNNLGNTYGVPVIRRLHNGTWGVIFGNGFGSSTGDAGIFVMTVGSDGTKTFYYLSAGQSGKADGIAAPSPADLDGDHIVDYVYAGDLNGNVWRFDLTDTDPTKWAVTPKAIFKDPAGRPITSSIGIVGSKLTSSGQTPRVILDFGTGRRIPITNSSPQSYDSGTHYLYGVWDSNMSAWNALGSLQYVSLTNPPTIGQTLLQAQTIKANGDGSLSGTNNPVCWADDQANCGSTPQYGFFIALPNTGEQTIFNPLIDGTEFIVNTTIPSGASSATSCKAITDGADTIALQAETGTPVKGLFNTGIVGGQTNGTGTPFVACTDAGCYIVTQTTGGGDPGPFVCTGSTCSTPDKKPPLGTGGSGKRLTWIERR